MQRKKKMNHNRIIGDVLMKRSVISLDTDHIKDYVFATGTLKEIRGASGILDELNRKKMYEVIKNIDPSAECVYANGGSGMFEVDEDKVADCISSVKKLYSDRTVTGSISGAAKSSDGEFNEIFRILNYRLRMAKDALDVRMNPVTHSFLRTCDSCGNEYVMYQDRDDLICSACKKKRDKDQEIKKKIKAVLSGQPVAKAYEIWDRLLPKLMKNESYEDKERPDEFERIGELSSPSGYMGLIYADGDSMGDKLEKLDFKEVRIFSETVDNAIFQAVLTAIQKHLHPKENGKYFPFDILMLGGDDLIMVTTADKAIETAMTISDTFEDITRDYAMEKFGKPLTVSVGVAIAHAKFPFGSFLNIAEDLLKFAKKMRNKSTPGISPENKNKGLINFQVVNASNSLKFSEDYKTVFKHEEDSITETRKFIRTLRPYDTQTLGNLTEKIRNLKQNSFPRNKLQALREAVFLNYGDSILTGLAVYNRLKKDQRQAMTDISKIVANTENKNKLVWFKKDETYHTPFLDVAELYDFIPGGER